MIHTIEYELLLLAVRGRCAIDKFYHAQRCRARRYPNLAYREYTKMDSTLRRLAYQSFVVNLRCKQLMEKG